MAEYPNSIQYFVAFIISLSLWTDNGDLIVGFPKSGRFLPHPSIKRYGKIFNYYKDLA
jgi:hypothetical protein